MKIKRALISVYDKSCIIDLVEKINKLGIEVIATSGTLKYLEKAGIKFAKHVSTITDFPEILNGRVKTGHPKIIGGILALRDKREHLEEIKKFGIKTIDLVICNFYPIKKEQGVGLKTLEFIDVGGPNLARAAAKNFENVVVIVNPDRYEGVIRELEANKDISIETRFMLTLEAFKETSRYDLKIYEFMKKEGI